MHLGGESIPSLAAGGANCLGPRAVDSLRHARASAGPAAEAQDVMLIDGDAVIRIRATPYPFALALLIAASGCTRATVVGPISQPVGTASRCAPDTLKTLPRLRYNLARFNEQRPRDSTRWSIFKAGLLVVRDTNDVQLVTKEEVCLRAAAVYTSETGDTARAGNRRVTVVRAGDRHVITDPFTAVRGGEWAIQLIVDRDWKVLARLGL